MQLIFSHSIKKENKMKKQKLVLNKKTIVHLNSDDLKVTKGGTIYSIFCTYGRKPYSCQCTTPEHGCPDLDHPWRTLEDC